MLFPRGVLLKERMKKECARDEGAEGQISMQMNQKAKKNNNDKKKSKKNKSVPGRASSSHLISTRRTLSASHFRFHSNPSCQKFITENHLGQEVTLFIWSVQQRPKGDPAPTTTGTTGTTGPATAATAARGITRSWATLSWSQLMAWGVLRRMGRISPLRTRLGLRMGRVSRLGWIARLTGGRVCVLTSVR